MEVAIEDHLMYTGIPVPTTAENVNDVPKKRSAMGRFKKPFGQLFRKKKDSVSKSFDDNNDDIQNGKSPRRKSESTADCPLNYDTNSSCDDPSQDHRTEPTTSVESIFTPYLEASLMCNTHSNRSLLGLVPGSWSKECLTSTSGSLASEHVMLNAYRDAEDELEDGNRQEDLLSEPNLLVHISTCPTRPSTTISDIDYEGTELILGSRDKPLFDLSEDDSNNDGVFLSFKSGLHTDDHRFDSTARASRKATIGTAVSKPKNQTNALTRQITTKVFITTQNYQPGTESKKTDPTKVEEESATLLPHEEPCDVNDSRPLKEITFPADYDQFGDMDDLTLPPISIECISPEHEIPHSRPIPPHNPFPAIPFNLWNAGSRLSRSSASVMSSQAARINDFKQECEELYAFFVQDRRGSSLVKPVKEEPAALVNPVPVEAKTSSAPAEKEPQESPDSAGTSAFIPIPTQTDITQVGPAIGSQIPIEKSSKITKDDDLGHSATLLTSLEEDTLLETEQLVKSSTEQLPTQEEVPAPSKFISLPEELAKIPIFDKLFRMYTSESTSKSLLDNTDDEESAAGTANETAIQTEAIKEEDVLERATTTSLSEASGNYSADREAGEFSDAGEDSSLEMERESSDTFSWISSPRGTPVQSLTSRRSATRSSPRVARASTSDDGSHSCKSETSPPRIASPVSGFNCAMPAFNTSSASTASSREDNLISEIKTELLFTVEDLKREGSTVVKQMIKTLSNQRAKTSKTS